MAQITLVMSGEHMARIVDAFCEAGGWTPGAGTREDFARARIADWVRSTTLAVERSRAEAAALAAAARGDDLDVATQIGRTDDDRLGAGPVTPIDLDDNPLLHSSL